MIDAVKRLAKNAAAPLKEISIAFFAIKDGDSAEEKGKKVAGTVAKRIAYAITDYWTAIACAMLVVTMKAFGYAYLYVFLALWALDMVFASVFVAIWQRTGNDLSLGEDFRRAIDVVHRKSRMAGMLAVTGVIVQALFWSGPEQIVIFFQKEIRTESRMALLLLVLTGIQAVLWAAIYSLGYDSVSELAKFLWKVVFGGG